MTKHIVSNNMVAHLWANQSQEWARNGHGSVSFQQRFYSSYRTAVARITDAMLGDKQVVLISDNHWGMATGRHISNALDAMRGHDRYTVMRVTMVQSRKWGETDQIPHTINIETMFKAYQAACERLCKPRSYFWGYSGTLGTSCPDTWENRARAIYAAAEPYREYCMAFNYEEPYPNFDYWIAKLKGAWARYYDPAQSDARAAREALNRKRAFGALAWAYAYIEGVAPKSAVYLRHVPRRLKREIEWRIRSYEHKPYAPDERITPEQWMDGQGNAWYNYHGPGWGPGTMLRRKGDTLQTSRGAEVPWEQAVKAFRWAQVARCQELEWRPNGLNGLPVGGFAVSRIEPNGDLHAGCHHLAYEEMQRLAIREAPEVVRACYPVPMVAEWIEYDPTEE